MALSGIASCAANDDDTATDPEARPPTSLQAGLDGSVPMAVADAGDARVPPPPPAPVTLARPDLAYSVDVTASGTGCPAGTWSARILTNGELAFQLSSLDAEVGKQQSIAVKDCSLALRLRSAAGRAYAVRRLEAVGYAYLEQDVRARLDTSASFTGTTPAAVNGRVEVTGPYDDTISLRNEPPADARLWSVCRTEHTLHVREMVRLVNSEPRRNGYFNLGGIDAAGRKLELTLEDRPCEVPAGAE
jgi:hypothetical protein